MIGPSHTLRRWGVSRIPVAAALNHHRHELIRIDNLICSDYVRIKKLLTHTHTHNLAHTLTMMNLVN